MTAIRHCMVRRERGSVRRWGALLLAVLTAGGVAAEPATPQAAYEEGLRRDQRAFEESFRDLNTRFKTALDQLQAGARARGSLEETVAARKLLDSVGPLATASVFAAGSPASGTVTCPVPVAPAGPGLIVSAYSNYLAKAQALVEEYNSVSSNRHARLLSALDASVRGLTKSGDLESAVKMRADRSAAAAAGPPRLALGRAAWTAPVEPLSVATTSHPAIGGWGFENSPYPARIIRPDGQMVYFNASGGVVWTVSYSVLDHDSIETATMSTGWKDRYRVLPDGRIEVTALGPDGESHVYSGERPASTAADAAPSPVVGMWVPVHLPDWRIAVTADGAIFSPKDYGRWTFDPAQGVFEARWQTRAPQRYRVAQPGERLEGISTTNTWRRHLSPDRRAQNRANLPAETELARTVAGFWTLDPDSDQRGLYELRPGGEAVLYKSAADRQELATGHWHILRDEALMVTWWSNGYVDYGQLPVVVGMMTTKNSRGGGGPRYRFTLPEKDALR
jgi:hypothetical protein